MTTKAQVFQELIEKVLGIECTLEPIGGSDDRDVQRESRVCEGERAGNVDRGFRCSGL
jgi:hypothetical protein